jgi:lactam utilization protein B
VNSIDLNADLGEGFGRWRLGDDEALLDIVTSANVACGFHAGDPSTMGRIAAAAAAGIPAIGEGFADRGYRPDGTLVPRSAAGAVIHDPETVVARALRMAIAGEVEPVDGPVIACRVASICVHGDTPGRSIWPPPCVPRCVPRTWS